MELNHKVIMPSLNLIGISVDEHVLDWYESIFLKPWEIDGSFTGWCPDYLNPFNMFNPLFNLQSPACFSRLNDTSIGGLTDMMESAIKEINRTKQLEIYGNIQSYIFDVNRPLTPASHAHISGWAYKVHQIHDRDLKGVNYNTMQLLEIENWYYK
jgi:ABC-type oligopeptide transport system substrate-binding subunit